VAKIGVFADEVWVTNILISDVTHHTSIPACPLGLAGLRELIRRRQRPPPAAAAVRPFYSNFDWLDYGLILLVN
jgi:hypothetical protein